MIPSRDRVNMTELERQVALLKSRGLMVPTTDPRTSKRPAEESSPEPSSKKTKHITEIASVSTYNKWTATCIPKFGVVINLR